MVSVRREDGSDARGEVGVALVVTAMYSIASPLRGSFAAESVGAQSDALWAISTKVRVDVTRRGLREGAPPCAPTTQLKGRWAQSLPGQFKRL
jgi:hypothetical protein